jgi:TnsA endonuclease N terminal.
MQVTVTKPEPRRRRRRPKPVDLPRAFSRELKPARLIIHRSTPKAVYQFQTRKTKGPVACESWSELRTYRRFEVDNNVVTFNVQPVTILYELDGYQHEYTPDAAVRYADRREEFVEVKPKRIAETERFKRHEEARRATFEAEGYPYVVLTEDYFAKQPEAKNAEELLYLRPTGAGSHSGLLGDRTHHGSLTSHAR